MFDLLGIFILDLQTESGSDQNMVSILDVGSEHATQISGNRNLASIKR